MGINLFVPRHGLLKTDKLVRFCNLLMNKACGVNIFDYCWVLDLLFVLISDRTLLLLVKIILRDCELVFKAFRILAGG